MSKKMLIDASHREETRVAVIANGKVEDFDFESESRKPLRGNIYLARVTRVEPSLQAAFVEYGGNRHGFLAFSEIHSDYYQIPVSDRDILRKAEELEAELAAQMVAEEQESLLDEDDLEDTEAAAGDDDTAANAEDASSDDEDDDDIEVVDSAADEVESIGDGDDEDGYNEDDSYKDRAALLADATSEDASADLDDEPGEADEDDASDAKAKNKSKPGKSLEERYRDARRERIKLLRNYRIQEVIKRRQILLVQVVKEERGNKGAALTTYLSLAGRYCVLMPNTSRGGGISRKITNGADRKRLRKTMSELEIPPGLGLIIRTAGSKRTKSEIKRDYDYLLRLWENIRDLTLRSIAPCLIYEEASLIKRAIRDLYDKDISAIQVEGDAGYREAKDFMKMLMPSHAKNVQPYRKQVPMFLAHKVEQQLDEMYQPVVKLKSGGYLVIQQTEALISIDVNSGKATKERNIEATALKTNCEAAVEVARQCRLRDLAGLVVVDFIDMEENRNNRTVEKKLKDAMKTDRARIQLGRISTFGLLEMSRQRRRSGIVDGTTRQCPTCHGAGAVRSHEMAALRILRAIEEEALAGRAGIIAASTSSEVALYILNNKRDWLNRIEETYALSLEINADPDKAGDTYEIEKRGPAREAPAQKAVVTADLSEMDEPESAAVEDLEEDEKEEEKQSHKDSSSDDEEQQPRRRRRRRGRRGGRRNRSSGNKDESQGDEESASGSQSYSDAKESTADNSKPLPERENGEAEKTDAAAATAEATKADDEAATDTDREKGDDASATASEEKPTRSRRRRSRSKGTAAKEAAKEDGEAPEKPAEQSATDAETSPAPAEAVGATSPAAEETPAEPVAAANDPANDPDGTDGDKVQNKADEKDSASQDTPPEEETAQADATEDLAEHPIHKPEASSDDADSDDDDKPKKTGWWQRALGKS